MIQERDDIVALDSAIIQHPRAWEASGHLAGFTDPPWDCRGKCKGASAPTTSRRCGRHRRARGHPLRQGSLEAARRTR